MAGRPTFTAAIAAYQAERWIADALDAILGQTLAPAQVVVIDDGSTDATAAVLAAYGDAIEVVHQPNAGCPAAFNAAFALARGDFVALCGADDIWEPDKLERQAAAIAAHPGADVLFGRARLFGLDHGVYPTPHGSGLLDGRQLRRELFRLNVICAPSVAIRRSLFERLGPFIERFGVDDYEYWMRCLRAGASFHFDPAMLVSYRRHDRNLSSNLAWMRRCLYDVHRWYSDDVDDRALARAVIARDQFGIAADLRRAGRRADARASLRVAFAAQRDARTIAWSLLLALPLRARLPATWAFDARAPAASASAQQPIPAGGDPPVDDPIMARARA